MVTQTQRFHVGRGRQQGAGKRLPLSQDSFHLTRDEVIQSHASPLFNAIAQITRRSAQVLPVELILRAHGSLGYPETPFFARIGEARGTLAGAARAVRLNWAPR